MMKSVILTFLIAFALSPFSMCAQNISVIELFTSQGCTSCPTADRIFSDIVKNPPSNLIALSCHITYFNRPAWKDTLSNHFCDNRQKAYGRALDLSSSYTPQMLINGKFDTVGNKPNAVNTGIRMGMSLNTIQPIKITTQDGYLDITLPKLRLTQPADIWLLSYRKNNNTIITAGANKGEMINYMNAVNNITKLMKWNGSPLNMAYPTAHMDADGYVILAQNADHTDVIAAGKTEK